MILIRNYRIKIVCIHLKNCGCRIANEFFYYFTHTLLIGKHPHFPRIEGLNHVKIGKYMKVSFSTRLIHALILFTLNSCGKFNLLFILNKFTVFLIWHNNTVIIGI